MGFLLLIPFFLIRFGLLSRLDQSALGRAAHFAPMEGGAKAAYWLYQLSNAVILLYPLFLNLRFTPNGLFFAGVFVYLAGNVLLIVSMVNFASPSASGIHTGGLYRISRNPMYVAYFVYFMGCALLTQSRVLLGAVLVFQVAAHWIILAEEAWCLKEFGEAYRTYMKKTRRYL